MKKSFNLFTSYNFEKLITLSVILFLFNLVFTYHSTGFLFLIHEILVFSTIYLLYQNLHFFLSQKTDAPLTLVINSGILAAIIFSILSITNSIYNSDSDGNISFNFFNSLLSIVILFILIISLVYIFTTFRELFFLRQKKDPSTYFNTMAVFISLSFLANLFLVFDPSIDYVRDAFYVVSIILIVLNSVRVAWIAFLTKKQKQYLLLISIVLTIVFGLSFSLVMDSNIVKKLIYSFSPGVHTIFSLITIYGMIYFIVIFFTTLFHLPTAEAFDRKALEVSSLMDITKLITQVFDFKELADTITAMTTEICNSDSAWLVTRDKNGIVLNSVYKIGFVDADKMCKLILEKNYEFDNEIKIVDSNYLNQEMNYQEEHFNSIAVAPLKVYGTTSGYLFTARKGENTFDNDDKKSIQTFANYAAVALENAMLIKESIEKERLEKELDVARDIQRKILPSKLPEIDGLQISALFVPAFEVGGDYYDFFELPDHKIGFVIADVSGKGISAAFIMAEVKGIFESLAKTIINPKNILIQVNEILKNSLDRKSFVTAIYGIIDYESGKLSIVRAGHTPLIRVGKNGLEKIQPGGIGLGLDFAKNFSNSLQELEINLDNNDIVVCYSDGIPEAKNSKLEDFGYERFENILKQNYNKHIDIISNEIMRELSLFSKDSHQHDDITLIIFRWNKN